MRESLRTSNSGGDDPCADRHLRAPHHYTLGTDCVAAERLTVLEAVYGPTSLQLLQRCGLSPRWRGVDMGCGTGLFTIAMARNVGPKGTVVGVDQAAPFVSTAIKTATLQSIYNVKWVCAGVTDSKLPENSFDLVHARCLLSHLNDPLAALNAMAALVRPGGILCVEDLDCGGVVSQPGNPALMQHLAWYQKALRVHGGDPLLGRKLPRLFRRAGFSNIQRRVVAPVEPQETIKRLYALTLAGLKPVLIKARLATAPEIDGVITALYAFADDPRQAAASTPMVQVWAAK